MKVDIADKEKQNQFNIYTDIQSCTRKQNVLNMVLDKLQSSTPKTEHCSQRIRFSLRFKNDTNGFKTFCVSDGSHACGYIFKLSACLQYTKPSFRVARCT